MRYGSGNILIFALTDLLGNFGRSMVFPYASLYILALGGDAAQIGVVAFVGQLAGLFLLPVAGHITDYADRVRIIVIAGLLGSLFIGLMVVAPGWQLLALASLLSGTIVIMFPAYASLIADSLPPEGRGQGIGVQNTISSSLPIIAPFIAGLVIDRYSANLGMRILYAAMMMLGFVAAYVQWRYLKETAHIERLPFRLKYMVSALGQAYRGVPSLVRQMSWPLRSLALVVVFAFMGNAISGPFWVVYATEHLHLSPSQWGLILLVESVAKMALFIPAGMLVDRWGRTRSMLLALVIWTACNPLFILLQGFTAILVLRAVLSVAFVLAIPACTAMMADMVPRAVRGQMMAAIGQGGIVLGMVGTPGGPAVGYLITPPLMIASLAGGWLYTLNPVYPWIAAAIAGVICILMGLFFIRDPHHMEQ
jgi:MFS family permease